MPDVFQTVAKLWPAGTELALGVDSTSFTLHPPGDSANFTRTAPPFVTSPDGTQTYEFLFWNTGRRMSNKRKGTWIFQRGGWGLWTATKWYGTPGGNGPPGQPRVRGDAFSINANALLSTDSPIDAAASTYAPGATPFNGDDHAIGTAAAAANVVAHNHMSAYDFAGWMELLWGGDPDPGGFVETDDGTSGVFGSSSFYQAVAAAGNALAVAMGANVDALATYVPQVLTIPSPGPYGPPSRWWEAIIGELEGKIPQKGDPSPMDLIRLAMLEELMQRTQPGPSQLPDFQGLIEAVPRMNKEELKRTKQSLQTTLDLGKSALRAIDARLKPSAK